MKEMRNLIKVSGKCTSELFSFCTSYDDACLLPSFEILISDIKNEFFMGEIGSPIQFQITTKKCNSLLLRFSTNM